MADAAEKQEKLALYDTHLELTVVLGSATMQIQEVLRMGRGAMIALDTGPDDPVKIYVNHKLVALGEVILIEETIAVTITEVL